MDILDQLKQQNEKQKDIIDKLYNSKGVSFTSESPESISKAIKVHHLKNTGSAGGAFLADIGATINKVIPNMKRAINPEDKKAMSELKEIEEFQDVLRTAYPSSVFGGDVVLPGATAAATIGLSAIPALAAGATEAASFSSSDQNPRTNAIIASILPFIPDAVKKIGGGLGEFMETSFRRGGDVLAADPEQQAGRAIKRFIDEADVDAEDILKARDVLGDGSTLADVQDVEGLAQGAAMTAAGRKYLPKFEERQILQQSRINDKVSEITGKKADNFAGDLGMFIQERSEAAKPLYEAAMSKDFVPSDDFGYLFKRLKNSGALAEAKKIARIEGGEISEDAIDYSGLHNVKIGIDDLIEKSNKAGSHNKTKALMKLKKDLLDEIEVNNPDYKMARTQFSGSSGVINAAELGSTIFTPKKMGAKLSPKQLQQEVAVMSSDEFTAFQGGMAKAVADKIADIPETADAARRLWSRPKVRESLKVAFENDKQFESFLNSLEKETKFTDTLRKLFQGSQTAQRQAGSAALKTGDISALEPFKKVLRGEISPEGLQSLTRLMFDSSVSNDEIRRVMVKAGVINETATTKSIAAMRKKWEQVWSRVNLPSVGLSGKAAVSAKIAPLLQEQEE
jgi:hypothetical protein